MKSIFIKVACFMALFLVVQGYGTTAWAQDYSWQGRWHHYYNFRRDNGDPPPTDPSSSTPTTSDTNSGSGTGTTDNNTPATSDSNGGTGSSSTGSSAPATSDPNGSTSTGTTSSTGSSSSTSSSGSSNTTPPTIPGPPVAGMVLTFDEEFNNLSASSSGKGTIWETKFYYNSLTHSNWGNLDLDPAVCNLGLTPYSINNGILDIHEQTTDPRLKACGITNPYTSGNLYSYYSFSQQYGYFEVRAQPSGLTGTDFAFWMLPKDGSWPPEIDITETLGIRPTIDNAGNHTGANNNTMSFPVNDGVNLSAGFHTYGVLWDADSITYMLDGKPVAKTSTGADEHKPFYIIVGLGSGSCGGWVGCPPNPSSFNADVYVDYVRAWQFPTQNPAACVGDCGN